jgi:hypothetical protein
VIGVVTKILGDDKYYVRVLGFTLVMDAGDIRTAPKMEGETRLDDLINRIGRGLRTVQKDVSELADRGGGLGWESIVLNHLDDCLEWIEIKTFKKFPKEEPGHAD